MKALAVANGVPADGDRSRRRRPRTRYENVVLSRSHSSANGWRSILLVSSPYHMRRAMLTWRQAAPDVDVTPTPVPQSQFYAHQRGASLDADPRARAGIRRHRPVLVARLDLTAHA